MRIPLGHISGILVLWHFKCSSPLTSRCNTSATQTRQVFRLKGEKLYSDLSQSFNRIS